MADHAKMIWVPQFDGGEVGGKNYLTQKECDEANKHYSRYVGAVRFKQYDFVKRIDELPEPKPLLNSAGNKNCFKVD